MAESWVDLRGEASAGEKDGRGQAYPSDLTDEQWALVQPALARNGTWGRPREVDLRAMVNALLYLVRTGCGWDYLPGDFPHRSAVRYYFDKWREDGTWPDLNDRLRRQVRVAVGRDPEPSAASTGEKKVAGRKRQVLVDTLGLLLAAYVHSAGESDAEGGAWLLFERASHLASLLLVWADQTYRGDLVEDARDLLQLERAIVERPPAQRGFVLLPRRWVVERSLAWFSRNRRLSKDYERLPAVSEAMLYIASIHRMLKVLRPDSRARLPYSRRAA